MSNPRAAASHGNVNELAAALRLEGEAYERAIDVAGLRPTADEWRRYIDRFLAVIAALLIMAGITAFFAWNWADLHFFAKFALLQFAIVGSAVMAWRLGIDSIGGRVCLFATAFLVGILFAVFGQVYQTGADPYSLFLAWAVLILPLAIVGRQAGIWMLVQILLGIAVMMYWTQVLYPPGGWWELNQILGPVVWLGSLFMDDRLGAIVFLLNAGALTCWEVGANRGIDWLQGRVFPRVTAFVALTTVLVPTVISIFAASLGGSYNVSFYAPLLYVGGSALAFWYYQYRRMDLFILTIVAFGVITVVMSLFLRVMSVNSGTTLILAILLIGQVGWAAFWLRGVSRRWETSS